MTHLAKPPLVQSSELLLLVNKSTSLVSPLNKNKHSCRHTTTKWTLSILFSETRLIKTTEEIMAIEANIIDSSTVSTRQHHSATNASQCGGMHFDPHRIPLCLMPDRRPLNAPCCEVFSCRLISTFNGECTASKRCGKWKCVSIVSASLQACAFVCYKRSLLG